MLSLRRKRQRKANYFILFIMIVVILFTYLFINQQIELYALSLERKNVSLQLVKAQEDKVALEEEYNLLHTLPYIEKIAREKMGLTKKGELPYVKEKER